jgi:hypothetical protein
MIGPARNLGRNAKRQNMLAATKHKQQNGKICEK